MELGVWPTRLDYPSHLKATPTSSFFPSRSLSQSEPSLVSPFELTLTGNSATGISSLHSVRSRREVERHRKSLSNGRLSPSDGFYAVASASTGLIASQSQSQSRGQEGPEKKLRRKNAASNLNLTSSSSAQMGTLVQSPNAYQYGYYPGSTTSSPPPPLSPSYSPSALSEQIPELLDGYGYPLSPVSPVSPPDVSHYEGWTGKQGPCKLLDTFRDRLEEFPDPDAPDIVEFHGHSRTQSDSVLFKTRRARKPPATATVVHQGTSFEILNPHQSLDFARIVSYIEDVDSHSTSRLQRDSYLNSSDGSNVIPEDPSETSDEDEIPSANAEERAHDDLVGDSPHHPMPSIAERLGGNDAESVYSRPTSVRPLSRPLSMVRPWTAHNYTDLGEPGPPINHDEDSHDLLSAPPLPPSSTSTVQTSPNDPIHLAALYDIPIDRLPAPGKGTDNPTAIIYSDRPPLRKRSTIRKKQSRHQDRNLSSPTSFSFKPSAAAATASAPLRRLRGMAQALRRKTFPRPRLG